MDNEQSKTLEALKTAIQMEIDGKEYYLKASWSSGNPMGEKLFKTLAKEEDSHRQRFEEIFKSIQSQKGWPQVEVKPHVDFKTLFASAVKDVKSTSTELEAVQTAMAMENKTRDYYQAQFKRATFEAEKKYFERLAGEEASHHAALLDYYEYLKDPDGWFTIKERHSLDGG
jgi:rubrerythrin